MSDTIVMIHGMWCSSWVWDSYKSFFEQRGFRCLTPTLRFHDVRPDEHPHGELGTTSLSDYAHDLIQEINKLDEPPIVMGHSMGGLLAQIVGSKVKCKAIIGLTTVAPSIFSFIQPLSMVRSLAFAMFKPSWWKTPHRPNPKQATYAFLHLMPKEEQLQISNRLVYDSGRVLLEIGYMGIDRNKAALVNKDHFNFPLLFISGSEDRLTPPSIVKKVAKGYSIATYKEFSNHAHWVVGEPGWEEIATYIYNWLNQTVKI